MEVEQLVSSDGSRMARSIFYEDVVYDAERRRIFQRCWLYVAHESQIPSPGDFVASYMGEEPVLVTRASGGEIHVLVNSCSHRGTRVCRFDEGTARTFTCPYHGWRFGNDGQLLGVPYSGSRHEPPDKASWGLHRAAKVECCLGLIFATFDPEAPPLLDFLGPDLVWYLETIFGRTLAGVHLLQGTHRWRISCNWKVPVENHAPDMIHVAPSHRSSFEAMGIEESGLPQGVQVITERGHLVALREVDDDDPDARLPGHGVAQMASAGPFLRQQQPEAESRLGPIRARLSPISVTVFPNLSIVPTNFTLRVSHPRNPGTTEMWSWCYAPAGAGPSVESDLLACYETMLGPAGYLETEDGENWSAMTAGARTCRTDPRPLVINMGLGEEHRHPDLPGSLGPLWSEHNQRGFYRAWRQWMHG